jgi:hypothetical protein
LALAGAGTDAQPSRQVWATGSPHPGINWWLLRLPAGDSTDPRAMPRDPARAIRRRALADLFAGPPICWHCPDCGSPEHGRPTWQLGCVSTSDLLTPDRAGQWLAVATGPAGLALGIDLVPRELPAPARRTMARYTTPEEREAAKQVGAARAWAGKEALSKARGTGLLGQRDAALPGGPLDTLAPEVHISDLDLGDGLADQLLASIAWVPGSQGGGKLPESSGCRPNPPTRR